MNSGRRLVKAFELGLQIVRELGTRAIDRLDPLIERLDPSSRGNGAQQVESDPDLGAAANGSPPSVGYEDASAAVEADRPAWEETALSEVGSESEVAAEPDGAEAEPEDEEPVEAHEGQIELVNAGDDSGATFRVELPLPDAS